MPRSICLAAFAILLSASVARAQTQPAATAPTAISLPPSAPRAQPQPAATAPTAALREIRADGLKSLAQSQILTMSGLQIGAEVGRDDLQAAADKLVQSGLFAHVAYKFQSRADGLIVTFQLEEAERIPAYFDNLPWFTDGELNDAIRAKLPSYNGTLPAAGAVVDQAAEAAGAFLALHGL